MASDELVACWAALVAFDDDVHAPQDNLTADQWRAAEQLVSELNDCPSLTGKEEVMFAALGSMLGKFDPPDLSEDRWALAEQMLAEYTAKVEA
jgi:hypothetical protein